MGETGLVRQRSASAVVGPSCRYHAVAATLEERIRAGEYPPGKPLPTVSCLAREFGVARGTVERALTRLESDSHLVSHHGQRWHAHAVTRLQSLGVRSFAQWAVASGLRPGGRFVDVARGRATSLEARELGERPGSPVLRVVRVRSLDGSPAMVEHTVFPGWLTATIESLSADAPSIADVVEGRLGVCLGHAEHRIEAFAATAMDGRLLGVSRGSPLLRVVRTARFADGRSFEYSDDRYLPDVVSLSLVTSSG
ncbi:GntR family transcriptional regulator [Nocardioides panzhihuensis]|uniref:GntR family transcriptional regulator n=1 Tax=Nocardioides panzhihuensis TaxID=860243 RepID=A0A7Z0IQA3_9ACTN|nr:GntR family transcriptional regulator [Nocardioides panzhihuensis]NYI75412.1 GntR family transcriptional regulator [Nocardioides panzhihuensis]